MHYRHRGYVQRIAMSNHRLRSCDQGLVRFSYRDYRDAGREKVLSLPATEFIRRFLQHVLPRRFVRIRYYGLLATRYRRQKLARCQVLLGRYAHTVTKERQALLADILGHEPDLCLLCGRGTFCRWQTIPAHPLRRRWLLAFAA